MSGGELPFILKVVRILMVRVREMELFGCWVNFLNREVLFSGNYRVVNESKMMVLNQLVWLLIIRVMLFRQNMVVDKADPMIINQLMWLVIHSSMVQ